MTIQESADAVLAHYNPHKRAATLDPITLSIILAVIQFLITEFGPMILDALKKDLTACQKAELRRAIWKSSPDSHYYHANCDDLVRAFAQARSDFTRPGLATLIDSVKGGAIQL